MSYLNVKHLNRGYLIHYVVVRYRAFPNKEQRVVGARTENQSDASEPLRELESLIM